MNAPRWMAAAAASAVLVALPAWAHDDAPAISAGDTAWMLAATALVLMMTIPGVALFYAGMVRKKNGLATMMQRFAITCLVTVLWMIAGYSLAFSGSGAVVGDLARFFLNGIGVTAVSPLAKTIPESVTSPFSSPSRSSPAR